MKYKYALLWGEEHYIVSRITHRAEWKNRNFRFEEREDWDWSKWQNAINAEPYWDSGLYKFILFNVSDYFGVDIKKLRPNDSLATELRFPSEKLHWRMVSELFTQIELNLDVCMKVEDYRDAYAPHELHSSTIAEILQFFQKLWSTFPHIDTPPWESKKWIRRWSKYSKGFYESKPS